MDMDFAVSCPLVRPDLPRIRFLFVGSRVRSTLPSDSSSRFCPCASLVLHLHQVAQGTCTPKLLDMPSTQPGACGAPRVARLRGLTAARGREEGFGAVDAEACPSLPGALAPRPTVSVRSDPGPRVEEKRRGIDRGGAIRQPGRRSRRAWVSSWAWGHDPRRSTRAGGPGRDAVARGRCRRGGGGRPDRAAPDRLAYGPRSNGSSRSRPRRGAGRRAWGGPFGGTARRKR
jgi:hypothetical protein